MFYQTQEIDMLDFKNKIDFQSFDYERTWWKFIQKRVVRT